MNRITRNALLLLMTAPIFLLVLWPVSGQSSHPHIEPAPDGTRGPSALLFRPDGSKLYVAEQDENRVAVLDPQTGKTVALLPSGGEQPTGLALDTRSNTLVAVNHFSGSVGLIDLKKGTLRGNVPLRGEPVQAVITANGNALVSVEQLDKIAVIDVAAARQTASIPVGRNPHALALTPDGTTLLCTGMKGSFSLIDTVTLKERARITLPAINLRGLAITPDGTHAVVTGQQPHNDLPTDRPEAMWSNVLCLVRLDRDSASVERVINLDEEENGAADPCDVVLDGAGTTAYVTLSGTHELAVVPLNATSSAAVRRLTVGANPRSIVSRPHASELYIANHLGNSVMVLASETPSITRTLDLGRPTPSPNRRLKGRFLFASADLTRGRHFTCETCHPDSGTDGLPWKFAHVHDGIEVRNTRDLRGTILLTAPYGWGGRDEDFEVFVNAELVGLMRTRKLPHGEIHALWDLVNETSFPPNPYRTFANEFTPAALRGKTLFEGQANCTRCHDGTMRGGGAKRLETIGLTAEGIKLDIPHLVGVYATAPYLHDGRAATLEEIFSKYNTQHLHGKADELSDTQMKDLIEYVREL